MRNTTSWTPFFKKTAFFFYTIIFDKTKQFFYIPFLTLLSNHVIHCRILQVARPSCDHVNSVSGWECHVNLVNIADVLETSLSLLLLLLLLLPLLLLLFFLFLIFLWLSGFWGRHRLAYEVLYFQYIFELLVSTANVRNPALHCRCPTSLLRSSSKTV